MATFIGFKRFQNLQTALDTCWERYQFSERRNDPDDGKWLFSWSINWLIKCLPWFPRAKTDVSKLKAPNWKLLTFKKMELSSDLLENTVSQSSCWLIPHLNSAMNWLIWMIHQLQFKFALICAQYKIFPNRHSRLYILYIFHDPHSIIMLQYTPSAFRYCINIYYIALVI